MTSSDQPSDFSALRKAIARGSSQSNIMINIPDAPCMEYVPIYIGIISEVDVGKSIPYMEHLWVFSLLWVFNYRGYLGYNQGRGG